MSVNEMGESVRCTKCELHKKAISIKIPGRTLGNNDILLVAEAPASDEDILNEVLIGKSGKKLDWLCELAGIQHMHRRTNAVRCFPHGTPKTIHIETCRPYLVKEISRVKPKVIVALGAIALKSLIRKQDLTHNRGIIFYYHDEKNNVDIPVIGTYHPAACLRFWEYDKIVIRDLKLAKKIATGWSESKKREGVVYVVGRDIELSEFTKVFSSTKKYIAMDAEFTNLDFTRGKLLCASFSCSPGIGYVVPFYRRGGKPFWPNRMDYGKVVE